MSCTYWLNKASEKCNSNCLLLQRKCVECLPNKNKIKWMHHRSKHWHLIEYIIVRKTDILDVRVTKSVRGAECWISHRLILSNFNFHLKPARTPQGKKNTKGLNDRNLKTAATKQQLCDSVESHLRTANTTSVLVMSNQAVTASRSNPDCSSENLVSNSS